MNTRQLIAFSISALLSFAQTSTLRPDPPHKCDSCDEWNKPRDPYRLFGNTYYVGTAGLSAVLVTSDAGHILLDGALPQSAPLIDANIRKLGFKTEDVRLILNSHAHYDHAGGIAALQRASGATVVTSSHGAGVFERGEAADDDPQFGFGRAAMSFPAVKNVRGIKDGEVVRVGNVAITAHLTPGHTPGSTTWSWRSCEGARCQNIVYADSLNPVAAPGFRFTGDTKRPSIVEEFRRSIAKVAALPCDILVAVHPSFGEGKTCVTYAADATKRLDERIAEERTQKPRPEASPARLDFPLFDTPYNVSNGGRAPSMAQSLAVTEGFFETSHRLIHRAWGTRTTAARVTIALWDVFDSLVVPLPGAAAWLHEEYHRAVMGRRGIDSFNDVYKFQFGTSVIAVSRVADDDLVRLKRDHPAEQVRLNIAGIEGEHQLVHALQKNQFFDGSRSWHQALYLVEKLGSAAYVLSGSWDEINADTDQFNLEDGADISVRDFTGHDFTAWVYDLHRPDEPYAARGVHPSGVGIDRYIKPADLTPAELSYLRRQGRLQFLNLIDPFVLGKNSFTISNPLNDRPMQITANAGHMLTSFGRTIDANIFLKQDEVKVFIVVHHYANGERWFPGFDVELIDFPLSLAGYRVAVTPRVALWLQPEGQRFRATAADAGGLAALKVHRSVTDRFGGFVEVEAKSAGWVAGNEYLDPNVSLRAGLSVLLR